MNLGLTRMHRLQTMSGCLSPASGSVVVLNCRSFEACELVTALSTSDLTKLGLPACTGCRQCLGVSCTQDSHVFSQEFDQYVALFMCVKPRLNKSTQIKLGLTHTCTGCRHCLGVSCTQDSGACFCLGSFPPLNVAVSSQQAICWLFQAVCN